MPKKPKTATTTKTEPQAEAITATPVDLSAECQRNEQGYGALPWVRCDHATHEITSDDLLATIERLHGEGFDAHVVSLAAWLAEMPEDPVAKSVSEWWANGELVSDWVPDAPATEGGPGWITAAVLYRPAEGDAPADAAYLYVRDPRASVGADAPQEGAAGAAAAFLIGNLMEASKRRFVGLAVPFKELNELEQSNLLRNHGHDVREAVAKAIKAIASNERLCFRAEVESVQFKGASDIKAALKLVAGPESHALADSAGGFVTVVIENVSELLEIPDAAVKGEPDQKALFDASADAKA